MVEIVKDTIPPAEERSLDFQDFSYSAIFTSREVLPEIHVSITFIFGKRMPNNFVGHFYRILDGEKSKCEAESFLDAAHNAWQRYGQTEEKYREFVRQSLQDKWLELKGEELTGRKLDFEAV